MSLFKPETPVVRSRIFLVASYVAELTIFFGAAAALAAGLVMMK